MFNYAEKIFDMYNEMENSVKNKTNNVTGAIKIAATQTIGDYMLPDLLIAFRKANPEIKIQLKIADSIRLSQLVENGMVDMVVTDAASEHKTLCCKKVSYDKMCVVAPVGHELATKSKVSMSDLSSYPIVLFEEGSGIRNAIDTYLREQNVETKNLNILMELASPESIKRSVESGVGISILPYSVISKEQQLKSIITLDLSPELTNNLYFVYRRQKFLTKNIEELADFSLAYFQGLLDDQSTSVKIDATSSSANTNSPSGILQDRNAVEDCN